MRTWKRVLALVLALIMLVPGGVTALAAEEPALQAEEALGEEAVLTPEEAPPEEIEVEPETAELAETFPGLQIVDSATDATTETSADFTFSGLTNIGPMATITHSTYVDETHSKEMLATSEQKSAWTDDNLSSQKDFWHAGYRLPLSGTDAWVQFDFGRSITIKGMQLASSVKNEDNYMVCALAASTDGENWTTYNKGTKVTTGSDGNTCSYKDDNGFSVRYVRFTLITDQNHASNGWTGAIKVFASPGENTSLTVTVKNGETPVPDAEVLLENSTYDPVMNGENPIKGTTNASGEVTIDHTGTTGLHYLRVSKVGHETKTYGVLLGGETNITVDLPEIPDSATHFTMANETGQRPKFIANDNVHVDENENNALKFAVEGNRDSGIYYLAEHAFTNGVVEYDITYNTIRNASGVENNVVGAGFGFRRTNSSRVVVGPWGANNGYGLTTFLGSDTGNGWPEAGGASLTRPALNAVDVPRHFKFVLQDRRLDMYIDGVCVIYDRLIACQNSGVSGAAGGGSYGADIVMGTIGFGSGGDTAPGAGGDVYTISNLYINRTDTQSAITYDDTKVTVTGLADESAKTAYAGDTITVAAKEGVTLQSVSWAAGEGTPEALVKQEDGTYHFTMPSEAVTITVVEEGQEVVIDPDTRHGGWEHLGTTNAASEVGAHKESVKFNAGSANNYPDNNCGVWTNATVNNALTAATGERFVSFDVVPTDNKWGVVLFAGATDSTRTGLLIGPDNADDWLVQCYGGGAGGNSWNTFDHSSDFGGVPIPATGQKSHIKITWTNADTPVTKIYVTPEGGTETSFTVPYTLKDGDNSSHIQTLAAGSQKVAFRQGSSGASTITNFRYSGEPEGRSVSGKVVKASDNTTGLAGVTVAMGGMTAITDANGDYSFDYVPKGTHTVYAMKSGLTVEKADVAVADSAVTVENIAFTEANRTIAVTVQQGDTKIANASVQLEDTSYIPVSGVTAVTANTEGVYSIPVGDRIGGYKVRVSAPTYSTVTLTVNDDALAALTAEGTLELEANLEKVAGTPITLRDGALVALDAPDTAGVSPSITYNDDGSATVSTNGANRQYAAVVVANHGMINGTMEFDATRTEGTDRWAIVVRSKNHEHLTNICHFGDAVNWHYELWNPDQHYDNGEFTTAAQVRFTQNDTRHFKITVNNGKITLLIDGVTVLNNQNMPNTAYAAKGFWGFGCDNNTSAIKVSNLYINRLDAKHSLTLPDNPERGALTAKLEGSTDALTSGASVYTGDTVVLTAAPSDKCQLKSLTVTSGGNTVPTTQNGNEYSFAMPNDDVSVAVEFEPWTFHVPLYGVLETSHASTAETTTVVEKLNASGYVYATAGEDNNLTIVGIKTTGGAAQPVAECDYMVDVTGNATATEVTVQRGGESAVVELPGEEAVDYSTEANLTVTATTHAATRGRKGTSTAFDGDLVDLSAAEFTFTKSSDAAGVYQVSGTTPGNHTVYVHPNGANRHPLVNSASTVTLAFGAYNGSDTSVTPSELCSIQGDKYLFFQNALDKLYWDKGDSVTTTNLGYYFYLYAKAAEGEAGSTEIPGYTRVTGIDGITDGHKYLIVPVRVDGHDSHYVLYPGHEEDDGQGNNWHSTLKVVDVTALTITGKKATKDTPALVVAGGKGYSVTVNPATTHNVTFSGGNFNVTEFKQDGEDVTPSEGAYAVEEGSAVTFKVEADAHYTLGTVTVGSETVTAGEDGAYSFNMGTVNVAISVTTTQVQTAAPTFTAGSYTMKYGDTAATFTLSNGPATTYQVYDAAEGGTARTDMNATVATSEGVTTLTLAMKNGTTVPAGTYYISATGDGEAESATRTAVTVTAYTAREFTVAVTGNGTFTYAEGSSHSIALTVTDSETGAAVDGVTIEYSTTGADADDFSTENPTFTNASADAHTVWYKVSKGGYTTATGSATITINKADATVTTAPTAAQNLTYDGTPKTLVTGGVATGGTLQYSKTQNDGYSADIPEETNAGTYSVWYKVVGDGNHNDTTPVEIQNIVIGKDTASVTGTIAGKTGLVYNKAAQALVTETSVEVTGGTLQYSTDDTNYAAGIPEKTDAGEYTVSYKVVADDSGNYVDSGVVTLDTAVSIGKATPTVTAPTAIDNLKYTTNEMALVTAGSTDFGVLKYSLDGTTYTENLPKATAAGTYTVHYKVDGSDNWNAVADATLSVTISNASQTVPGDHEGYTIDYTAETIAVTDGFEVSTANDFATKVESGATITPGVNLYIRKAAKENYDASDAATITVPARGVVADDAVTRSYANETVMVPAGYKYVIKDAQASDTAADDCTETGAGTPVAFGPGKYLYVYKEATESAFKTTVKEIVAGTKPDAPNVAIDYVNETLNTTADMEYLHEGTWTACEAGMSVTNAGFGWGEGSAAVTVQFRTKATDGAYASAEQSLTIKARPGKPETSNFTATAPTAAGTSDGQITVTTTDGLEYKVGSTGTYNDVTSPITGLAGDAAVYFRKKAVADTSFASAATEIHVPQYVAENQTAAPAFESKEASFAKGETTVTFTLTNHAAGKTYKVYTAATDGAVADGGYPQVSVADNTLTLTVESQPNEDTTYYVTATEDSKTESPRVALTVKPYVLKDIKTLQALTVTADGHAVELSPAFAAGTTSYTASVANSVTSVTVTATVTAGSDATAVVKVDTAEKTNGVVDNLAVGDTTITVTVTAENGTATQDYTIVVTRDKAKTEKPTFQATSYTMTSADATTATFTVTNTAAATTYKVYDAEENGNEVAGVTASIAADKTLTLTFQTAPTENKVLWIGAENDGEYASARTQVTVQKYVKSTEARLATLSLGDIELNPAFNAETFSYTATVEYNVSSVTVTATAAGSSTLTSGNGSHDLNVGENTITVKVTAEDGVSYKDYTITVTRKNEVTAAPTFTSTSFTMTTAAMTAATFTVDGTAADSYKVYESTEATTVAAGVSAAISGSTLTLTFTSAPTEDKTLYISATKGSADESTRTEVTVVAYVVGTEAKLESLSLEGVTLNPTFDADTLNYTATVENDVTSVTVAATAAGKATVNAATIGEKNLNVGDNTITVTVTAEDGTHSQNYVIKVTRKANKTALEAAIANANTAKTGVIENDATDVSTVDKGVRFVSTEEMTALTDAIAAATEKNNKVNATQAEVDGAVTALNGAVSTFNAAIKTGTKVILTGLEVDKETVDLVGTASETVGVTTTPPDATDTLVVDSGNTAVARATIEDKTITIIGVGVGSTDITVSGTDASSVTATIHVTVTMDKTALENEIAKANAAKEGVVTGTDASQIADGIYFVSEDTMTEFETAISAAETVKNDAEATDAEVAQAVTTLSAAIAKFNTAKQKGTKVVLTGITLTKTEVTLVGTASDTVTVTVQPEGATDTLKVEGFDPAVISVTFRDGTITITGVEVGSTTITVKGTDAADVTATITVTVTANRSALTDALAAANAAKENVTVGESAGEVEKGTKYVTAAQLKALTDAIAAAEGLADTATQAQVNAAVAALTEATTTFTSQLNGQVGTKVVITVSPAETQNVSVNVGEAIELAVTATVAPSTVTATYAWTKDGEALENTTATFTVDSAVEADGGVYVCTVSAEGAENKTVTFNVTVNVIPKYTLTVTGGTISGVEGTSVELEAETSVTITANAAPEGQRFKEWTLTGVEVADATSQTITFAMPSGDVTAVATYEAIPEVPVTVLAYNGVYDGQPHGITVTSDAPGAVVKYGSIEGMYTLDRSPVLTTAGSVTVYYQVSAPGYLTVTGSANITINKASVNMTVDAAPNNIHSANVADRLVLFTVNGLPEGSAVEITCADAGITVENGSVILPDETATYVFTAKFAGDSNHLPAEARCTVIVTKSNVVLQNMTGVSAESITVDYDGKAKTITVTGVPEGAVITYCDTENGTYSETQPVIVNAGRHTVYYKVSAAGCNTFTGSATITINKGTPNVTITADKPELSGGGVVKFTVDVPDNGTVNVSCDDGAVTLTRNDDGTFTAPLPNVTKDYTFTATYGGSVNYKPGSAYCAVIVTAVEDLDAVVAADKAKVEGGSYRTTQAKASTQEKAVAEAERLMAALGISSETIVNVEEYVAAVAGTASDTRGTNGKLVFTVTLHKDGAADVTTKTLTMTITATAYSNGGNSGNGPRPSGGTPSQGSIVKTENPDGSTTTVATDRKGNVTETTERPDGTVEVIETKVDGTVTETITQPDGGKIQTVSTPDEGKTITVTDAEGVVEVSATIPAVIPAPEVPFVDVPENHWAQKAINTIHGLGLVNGVDEEAHIYDMTSPMTRGALVTVLHRFSNGSTDLESVFDDVAEGDWYADGVAWAAKNGVVNGYDEHTFAPEDTITRQQITVMLYRYAKLLGVDVTVGEDVYVDSFGDADQIGSWALDAMEWAYATGLVRGRGGNQLAPTATATRAEVATILARFIDMLK